VRVDPEGRGQLADRAPLGSDPVAVLQVHDRRRADSGDLRELAVREKGPLPKFPKLLLYL
jgi:hypothetical protein